jgi:hypothetical protein
MFIQKELECSDSARDGTKFNSSDTFGNMRALDQGNITGIFPSLIDHIDSSLNFGSHIGYIAKKIERSIGILSKLVRDCVVLANFSRWNSSLEFLKMPLGLLSIYFTVSL